MKKCICCGLGYVDDGGDDICNVCGWQDDDIQNDDPDFTGGANALSLNDYRKEFKKRRVQNPNYTWDTGIVELNYRTSKLARFSESATKEDIIKYHRHNTPESLKHI